MASSKEPLSVTHPQLAAQADGWDPATLTAGSNKKMSWKCEHFHKWYSTVNDRSSGKGCPVCANKLVLAGYNDLASTNPELAKQADGWDPKTLTANSGKRVGWRCEQGHTWSATVDNRSKGTGCPFCSRNRSLAGYSDLATTNPELAKQADGWDPKTLAAYSSKKVGWRCEQGHIWSATVSDRSSGRGCPVCSNKQVLVGYNDLASTNPELAKQADGWDPKTVSAGSHKKLGWQCKHGHKWSAVLSSRARGNGCPVCANQLVLAGYNDLASTNPELAKQADGWDPKTLAAHSNKQVGWRCEQGHTWETSPNTRSRGIGCPVCSNKQVLVGYNDLASTNPGLAAQADGWDPKTLTGGSGKKVGWRCEQGHTWKTTVASRSSGSGCPVCSEKQVLGGYNDLASTNPELAAQADGWDPTTVSAGSHKKLGWQCGQGHKWSVSVSQRSRGHGCPICSNKMVLAGYNDLATTNPELAAQADGWDPTTLTQGSTQSVGWRCEKGHKWKATLNDRSSGNGCPVCSGHQVLAGYNDLVTTNPEVAAQADGWDPTTVSAGSSKKVGWRCEKGHKWKAKVANRAKGIGCPSCAATGFDPNQNGYLYLVDNDGLEMLQIGISNTPKTRLAQHLKRDWEVIEVRGPMKGHLAQQLETAILHAVERRGAVLGHKAQIEKFDGYSEAWTKDSLPVASFKQLLDWVYEDDEA